jgi:hypothetical protein
LRVRYPIYFASQAKPSSPPAATQVQVQVQQLQHVQVQQLQQVQVQQLQQVQEEQRVSRAI